MKKIIDEVLIELNNSFMLFQSSIKEFEKNELFFRQSQPQYEHFMKIYNDFLLIKDSFFENFNYFINSVENSFKIIVNLNIYEEYKKLCGDCSYYSSMRWIANQREWLNEQKNATQNKQKYSAQLFYLIGSLYMIAIKHFKKDWQLIYQHLKIILLKN